MFSPNSIATVGFHMVMSLVKSLFLFSRHVFFLFFSLNLFSCCFFLSPFQTIAPTSLDQVSNGLIYNSKTLERELQMEEFRDFWFAGYIRDQMKGMYWDNQSIYILCCIQLFIIYILLDWWQFGGGGRKQTKCSVSAGYLHKQRNRTKKTKNKFSEHYRRDKRNS